MPGVNLPRVFLRAFIPISSFMRTPSGPALGRQVTGPVDGCRSDGLVDVACRCYVQVAYDARCRILTERNKPEDDQLVVDLTRSPPVLAMLLWLLLLWLWLVTVLGLLRRLPLLGKGRDKQEWAQ